MQTALNDGVLEITLANGATNALDAPLRSAIAGALADLSMVRAVVIHAAGRVFSAGADLPGPDADRQPTLAQLCALIEGCGVPVVVAVQGVAAGPGLELALAAHARVAGPGARFSLPAVLYGLISGAGATQRLPRLIGTEAALRLLLTGAQVTAAEALATGLVDRVTDTGLLAAARSEALARPVPPPSRGPGVRDPAAFQQAIVTARLAAMRDRLPAPGRIVECVEAAHLLPPAQGLAFEAAAAAELGTTPEAAALSHLARAERRAASVRAGSGGQAQAVTQLGLGGEGPVMAPFALAALARGLSVTLADPDRSRLTRTLEVIAARQEAFVQDGRMTGAAREAAWARLTATTDTGALAQAEAVVWDGSAPLPVLAPDVPVLSTGGAGGTALVRLTGRVAELAVRAGAAPGPLATALALLRRLGLTVVLTRAESMPDGVARQLVSAGAAAVAQMVAMGVAPAAIGAALQQFGLPPSVLPMSPDHTPVRAMTADEIVARWTGALVNAAALMIESGGVVHPYDIDLMAVAALGFPRAGGGPLHHAERRGLLVLRRDLGLWAADDPLWTPAALLDRMISAGGGFAPLSPE